MRRWTLPAVLTLAAATATLLHLPPGVVHSPPAETSAGLPRDVVLLVDTSASMAEEGRLDALVAAVTTAAASLPPGDRVGIVAFSDRPREVLPLSPVPDAPALRATLSRLEAGRGTHLYQGLLAGLELVASGGDEGRSRHLVLVTDGEANLGISDPERLAGLAARARRQGVRVDALGLGEAEPDVLEPLARAGGGACAWATPTDLPRILVGLLGQGARTNQPAIPEVGNARR